MADKKYPNATPQDIPEPTGNYTPPPAGSGILVDGKPLVPPKSPPKVMKKAKGGKVGSASSRGDGCAQRGKTKGTIVMCGGGMAK
jgi:hypothetical protein